MKYFPKRTWLAAGIVFSSAFALRADLTRWAETVDVRSRLEAVFFRPVAMPGGQVAVRRAPKETRVELSRLLSAVPNDTELYSLRALEDEQQLDFDAAESDWKKQVEVAADKGEARLALADYYHRRHQSQQEWEALTAAAREAAPPSERLLPETAQRPWKTHERLLSLIDEQRLSPGQGIPQAAAWIQRFPKREEAYTGAFQFALTHGFVPEAQRFATSYQSAFPQDLNFPIEARAEIAGKSGRTADALAVYNQSYQPSWPDVLLKKYFSLLRESGQLRIFLENARAAQASNPLDLNATARLFHYWQQQGNAGAALKVLGEFRQRKDARNSPWTAAELSALGRLAEDAHDYDEAARSYYALYSVAPNDAANAEQAMGSLICLLFNAPDYPIHFGAKNLSLYQDVATLDPHPGFLNGVLSLLMNETEPASRHASQERNAAAYFHRAQAAELVALFESRFPNSAMRAELRERHLEAYAIYGDSAGVIRTGPRFLTDFPNAPNRTSVALRIADAYARTNRINDEFAQYDALLAELAQKADGVPVGASPKIEEKQSEDEESARKIAPPAVRSPEYAQVLARYVARLVALKRIQDALTLYRLEIDRNPDDPGLYELLAQFLEQNQPGAEVERVYQRAIQQFQDTSWRHKLARWYLRQQRQTDAARLTREVVTIFSGSQLETYFREIVTQEAPLGPALYLQLNLAAHERFPHQLNFVRNLLTAYATPATTNDVAAEALLRQSWYHADDLRMRFFERLSRSGRLTAELAQLRASNQPVNQRRWPEAVDQNPAAVRLLADGELWRSHFELAAPMLDSLVASYPADSSLGRRAASVFRSLGAGDASVRIETNLSKADPLSHDVLTRIGEIQADRGQFAQAQTIWNRIPEIEPSKSEGYLETATIFWDYYQFDDALRTIDLARTRLAQPALFAYQAGAIHENRRDYDRATREYASAALQHPEGNSTEERRLLRLARRNDLRLQIDQLTSNLASARNPDAGSFQLRVAFLKSQNRRQDLEQFLDLVASRADAPETFAMIEASGRSEGFPAIERAALEGRIAHEADPIERINLRLALVRLNEAQNRGPEASGVMEALYRENPVTLGVIRAAVDYHWRSGNRVRAVDVLEEASRRAQPSYRTGFLLEAARKSIDAGNTLRGRSFANTLLAEDPFRGDFVALMADTYARTGDDAGLRTFYLAKIADLAKAPLADRAERTAMLRRSLIPVLVRSRDFSAALDQYIEVLNRYPEDGGLANEAAHFARTNGLEDRLRAFYQKAVADSPKDVRWPLVLARILTQFEDYRAAISAYSAASTVRPDRTDLLSSRLLLEERLLRLDEAAATADRLYELTYRNPEWTVKLAEIHARQGRKADAIAALNRAWIEPTPDKSQSYFSTAAKLEAWGMLTEARAVALNGLRRTAASEPSLDGESLYARLSTRLRDSNAAFVRLAPLPAAIAAPVARQVGNVVQTSYTPEEKSIFALALATRPRRIEIARAAGLADREAQWLYAAMMAAPGSDGARNNRIRLTQLQKDRGAFGELGRQLEAYDAAIPPNREHSGELEEAARAFRAAADPAGELRVLQKLNSMSLYGDLSDRFAFLLATQPARLAAILTQELRESNAYALLNNTFPRIAQFPAAQQALNARALKENVLWGRGYTALTGTYFNSAVPAIRTAFTGLLGDMTIGTRLATPLDRNTQLAGDLWFYFGGRYGEYLTSIRQPGAEDFLPAMAEAAPENSNSYFQLGEFLDGTNPVAASEQYRFALELSPARPDIHSRLAAISARAGRPEEATAEWKLALQLYGDRVENGGNTGEVRDTLVAIAQANMQTALRDDVDALLRRYIRRNGGFQIETLLQGALRYSTTPDAGVAWIADFASAAADPAQFVSALVDEDWIPEPQKGALHARLITLLRSRALSLFGDARKDAESNMGRAQLEYARYLVAHRDNAGARRLVDDLGADFRESNLSAIVSLDIQIAARTGGLAAKLTTYDDPVRWNDLLQAASALRTDGDLANARRVAEFVYQRQLASGNIDPSVFLGLAKIRLEESNTPQAMTILRRMVLVSGEAFSSLDPAAASLEQSGHPAEAAEFLTTLVKAEPWNDDARRRLAETQGTGDTLLEIAQSPNAAYGVRVTAARGIRRLKATPLTGVDRELTALSSQAIPAAPAPSAYAAEVRTETAGSGTPAQQITQLAAVLAIRPGNEQLKIDLLRASIAATRDGLTLALAESMIGRARDEEEDRVLPGLDPTLRTAILRGAADAHLRAGELADAARLYRTSGQEAAAIAAEAALERRSANEARRPVFAKELNQDRLVRPMLTGAVR